MLGLDGAGKTTILNYFTGESNLGTGSSDGLLGDAKTTIGFRVARVTVKKQNGRQQLSRSTWSQHILVKSAIVFIIDSYNPDRNL